MTYEPQPGDHLVVDTHGPVAWAIKGVCRSKVSHAAVYVGDGRIVEAMPGGARIARLDTRPGAIFNEGDPVWQQGMAEHGVREAVLREAVCERAISATTGHPGEGDGIGYGFPTLITVGALQYGVKPYFLRRAVRRSADQICSQLTDWGYLTCRYPLHLFADGRWEGDVTPQDLHARILDYREAAA